MRTEQEKRDDLKNQADDQNIDEAARKEACFEYALMCYEGKGRSAEYTEEDRGEELRDARYYYKKAAIMGHVDATYRYALMCDEGEGGQQKLDKARKYYKIAALKGHVDAAFNYAAMCYSEEGRKEGAVVDREEELKQARKYYKQAADQNDTVACFRYACMCKGGEGGVVDRAEARRYYKRAADNRDDIKAVHAAHNYAELCKKGLGRSAEYTAEDRRDELIEAREYYKYAAEKGFDRSQSNYAFMCYHGQGGDEDKGEAREYYKKAADQNLASGCFSYALMCYEGEGRSEEYAEEDRGEELIEARKYFKDAANLYIDEAIKDINKNNFEKARAKIKQARLSCKNHYLLGEEIADVSQDDLNFYFELGAKLQSNFKDGMTDNEYGAAFLEHRGNELGGCDLEHRVLWPMLFFDMSRLPVYGVETEMESSTLQMVLDNMGIDQEGIEIDQEGIEIDQDDKIPTAKDVDEEVNEGVVVLAEEITTLSQLSPESTPSLNVRGSGGRQP